MSRLRVLITSSYYWPEDTGNAPYVTGLAEHLAARGDDVVVATGFPHYPEWESSARHAPRRGRDTERGQDPSPLALRPERAVRRATGGLRAVAARVRADRVPAPLESGRDRRHMPDAVRRCARGGGGETLPRALRAGVPGPRRPGRRAERRGRRRARRRPRSAHRARARQARGCRRDHRRGIPQLPRGGRRPGREHSPAAQLDALRRAGRDAGRDEAAVRLGRRRFRLRPRRQHGPQARSRQPSGHRCPARTATASASRSSATATTGRDSSAGRASRGSRTSTSSRCRARATGRRRCRPQTSCWSTSAPRSSTCRCRPSSPRTSRRDGR